MKRNRSIAGVVAGITAGIGLAVFGWWYTQEADFSYPDESQYEVAELTSDVMTRAIALARTSAAGGDCTSLGVEGRRTYVCAHASGTVNCGVGEGADLGDAVCAAAKGIAITPASRLKIDVVTHTEAVTFGTLSKRSSPDAGVHGFVLPGQPEAFVLPSEVLSQGIYEEENMIEAVWPHRLADAWSRRYPPLERPDKTTPMTIFRTASWVEGADGTVFRTYRLHPWEHPTVTDAMLEQRIVWAADHLLSTVSAEGKIRYTYEPTADKVGSGYNLLRHGGTTYSLLQAWERLGVPAYRLAAEQAIRYLRTKSKLDQRTGPYGGGEVLYVIKGDKIKLGGAGLALLAIAQHAEATGDTSLFGEDARRYARHLVSQQKEDGEFHSYAPVVPGGERIDRKSAYYPGEAIVGLMRWYEIEPDPLWLETAVRGADWLIDVRDAGKSYKKLANDHWLMIGLSYLYEHTKDPRYLEHSRKLAKAVAYQQDKNRSRYAAHRDWYGGYYRPPRSTPASTRAEGLIAVLDTCELAGIECPEEWKTLDATIQHMLQCQYTPDTLWWVGNPAAAFGGMSGGIVDPTIRNDFVQHAMSAFLGYERLRAARSGRELPGGPAWSGSKKRFGGVDPVRLSGLRDSSRRFLGSTTWEPAVPSDRIP